MGAADVVPGVSGGTIAFITGIYEELIESLRRIGPAAVGILMRDGLGAFWSYINGAFLLSIFAGISLSLLSLAQVISFALETYPILVWAFFFGLILASSILMARHVPGWRWSLVGFFMLGAVLAFVIAEVRPTTLPNTWWVLMASGAVAICAMILPGISGSFILLLIGVYAYFIEALQTLDLLSLGAFASGCVVGLLLFSHLLSWLLRHFHDLTIALLIGFLLGSLNVIWPWKHVLQTVVNRHGEVIPLVQENVSPWIYSSVTGVDAQLPGALGCMAFGLALVFVVEYLAKFIDAGTH